MTDKDGPAGAPEVSSLNGWVDNGSVNRNENIGQASVSWKIGFNLSSFISLDTLLNTLQFFQLEPEKAGKLHSRFFPTLNSV